jgi:cell wall-associated NlpC family hydrolase
VKPHQLIGLPYRLGADPVKHGAGDCLSLCRTVLKSYGISSPDPERSWYRRLRKKDYSIFTEELNRWGVDSPPKLGAIALCKSENGYGMAAYYEEGWLNYQKIFENRVVVWSPLNALMAHGCYYQRK